MAQFTTATYGQTKAKPFEQQLRDFCHYYDAKARQSNKRYHRLDHSYVDYFTNPANADFMQYSSSLRDYTVPMYEVDLPADKLERLLELDQLMRAHGRDLDWVEQLKEKERFEHFVRSSNPAVKKAYENYSLLLNMVKDSYK